MPDDQEAALIKLFGSTSRAGILLFLFQNPQKPFYQREIMFQTGLSLQAIQRELENLRSLSIIIKQETRSRVYYHLDSTSIFFEPLKKICDSGKSLTE